jgi:hypothetical protein
LFCGLYLSGEQGMQRMPAPSHPGKQEQPVPNENALLDGFATLGSIPLPGVFNLDEQCGFCVGMSEHSNLMMSCTIIPE